MFPFCTPRGLPPGVLHPPSFQTQSFFRASAAPRRAGRSILLILALACFVIASGSSAQSLNFTMVPSGYTTGTITLPREFGEALGADPSNPNEVYAAVGSFGDMNLAKIDLTATTATIVATGPFASIGGISVISATQIIIVDNASLAGEPPDETILLATDDNPQNGSFDDPGEIIELIAPILTENWTGSQALIAPAGDPSGIPSGSILVQTADGAGNAELLVITNPLGIPAYHPPDASFFAGFDYNGGFDFDSEGRIMMGTLNSSFTGEVYALVNTNADDRITTGEFNAIVSGENGMSDLIMDGSDRVYFLGVNASFAAAVRTFRIPKDPLAETATPEDFALTDSGFLVRMILNSKYKNFAPNSGPNGAVMLIGGYDAFFSAVPSLLTLTPSTASNAVKTWAIYD